MFTSSLRVKSFKTHSQIFYFLFFYLAYLKMVMSMKACIKAFCHNFFAFDPFDNR